MRLRCVVCGELKDSSLFPMTRYTGLKSRLCIECKRSDIRNWKEINGELKRLEKYLRDFRPRVSRRTRNLCILYRCGPEEVKYAERTQQEKLSVPAGGRVVTQWRSMVRPSDMGWARLAELVFRDTTVSEALREG